MNVTKPLLFLGLLISLSSLTQDSLSPVIHASVSTKKKNGKVEIKVSDNRNGIPQNVLHKIFQPFLLPSQQDKGQGWAYL